MAYLERAISGREDNVFTIAIRSENPPRRQRKHGKGFSSVQIDREVEATMRKILLVAVLAVCLPTAALAAQPSHPATPAGSNANSNANGTSTTGASNKANLNAQTKTLFILRGTLGTYLAVNGATNGSIAITVKSSNHEGTLLKTMTLTFAVNSKTKLVGTLKSGDTGIVKVRAPKTASAAALQAIIALQAIDQGVNT
jgi:opacity protein-like surface antigen